MATMQLTPRATQTDKTKQFVLEVDEVLSTFEEEMSSLSETTKESAYENFVTSYRDAMIPIWGPSKLADVKTVLDTVTDKKFSELQVMKTKLREKPPESKVVKENKKIPTLEDFMDTMQKRLPKTNLPNAETCLKIANVFSNLAEASRCRATTWPPRPSSTAECLHLIARLREEQASAASWEPRPQFEAAKMD